MSQPSPQENPRDLPVMPETEAHIAIVHGHVLWATGAGAVPLPVVDIALVAGIQLNMLKKLAALYHVDFDETRGRAWLSILTTNIAARVAANAFKLIPGIGSLIGGGAMAIMSGASTYALGTVVAHHFRNNGTFEDLDMKTAKAEFDAAYGEGKAVATRLRTEAKAKATKTDSTPDSQTDNTLDKLERLVALHANGTLTDDEFSAAKAKLLGL
ncbi:MAG: hypothetical protein ACI9U2_004384 [Bradymonadia bacterium]|jgi:uncharacterized protein (DUF697 family)